MKKHLFYTISIIGLFASCTDNLPEVNDDNFPEDTYLSIEVDKSDFHNIGNGSRVSYNGLSASFEKGDAIGVIIMKADKSEILDDNIKYEYTDDGKWKLGEGESEYRKTVVGGELNFLIYYPYKEGLSGINNISELKQEFTIDNDLSSIDKFEQSDLMYADFNSSLSSIRANLKHAYSLVSVAPVKKFISALGDEIEYVPSGVTEFKLKKGNDVVSPLFNGSEYLFLSDNGVFSWSYKYNGAEKTGKHDLNSAEENKKYKNVDILGNKEYGLSKADIGDFYCIKDGKGYILPKDAGNIVPKHKCIGVVVYGKEHEKDTAPNNCNESSGLKFVYGYAIGLEENSLQWSTQLESIATSDSQENWDGYYNQKTVKENGKLDICPSVKYCVEYPELAPSNTSGWYMPSFAQLQHVHQNKSVINSSLGLIGEDYKIKDDDYWTSSSNGYLGEQQGRVLWGDNIENETCKPKTESYLVRPIIAF